ncbi:class I SAM-dependent methyltransferase [Brevibacillus choshinensis]|uniref:class I SAM-dependent methyltransferase n=1 Tax=Brevibacillus choshinensis TaxID=54911 RepID=UPI002E1D30A9|nr:class I SAM-dependent methyltransferase [Brevibacillus choshinensis]MED4779061.1 class I SAM-dependent methyltransferase [Brevibacillus choshinensis]
MSDLQTHYRNLFLKFGDSAESAQYRDRVTQVKRFEILIEIEDINGSKVLDFGCGTAHFATYLKEKGIKVDYTGVDFVKEFLQCAKEKHPDSKFCSLDEALQETYDYVFVSGVFNNVMENNEKFYKETVKQLYQVANKGLAFNMMSSYVDYYDEGLYYEKPENVFRFIKNEVSPYVTIRNDYQIRDGVIPFEFAVYVYKR